MRITDITPNGIQELDQAHLELIEKSSSEQVLRFLQRTLTPTQKAALKKVIRGFELCDQYVCDENGNEIGVPSVDLDPLISALTGE